MALKVLFDNVNLVVIFIPLLVVGGFLLQLIKTYQSGIPGPFLARFTRFWLFNEVRKGTFHTTNVKLHQIYGPIVRIRPNEYSIDDPTAMKTIYGAGSKFTKSDWYRAWTAPGIEHFNLFALRDSKMHATLRRQMSTFYSLSHLRNYECFVDNNTRILCTRFQEFARAGTVFDLGHWLQCYAFDVITEITFGAPFGFLEAGDDIENLINLMERIQKCATPAGCFPLIYDICVTYFSRLNLASAIPLFAVQRIIQREQGEKANMSASAIDFLTLLLDIHAQKPEEMTKDIIISTCSQNIAAGSDTTGISLTTALCNFAKDPSATEKLLKEVEQYYPSRNPSDLFTFKETQYLKYLQAAIKESLRLHPATGMPLGRRIPKEGAILAGRYFPEGAVVGVNTWVAHHNKSIFGKDAHIFRPERWLEADEDQLSSMERYFIPFGSGARTCLGKNISMLEMSKAIPVLLMNFEFHLQEHWQKEFETTESDWFVKPRALPVSVRVRV